MYIKLIRLYREAYTGLPRAAWLLSLVIFVNRSGTMVLFFMTLYLTQKMHLPISLAGQMISVYGFGSLAGSYLGGWLSDIIGTRRVQLMSLIANGFGFIALAYITSLLPIAVMLFFIALLGEAFRPANATAMAEVCPPLIRARGYALNRLAANLGITIGPAIGGFLATKNYTYLFWVDGITCLIAAFLVWIYLKDTVNFKDKDKMSQSVAPRSPWKDLPFIFIVTLIFMCALIFVQLFNSWPVYLRQILQLRENQIGLLLTLNAALIVLIEMPLIHKIEKYNHLRLISFGALLLGFGFAILPFGNTFLFVANTVILWTFGEMLVFPLVIGFIANWASDRSRGKYIGIFNLSFSLAFSVGPAMGAYIYGHWGTTILWLGCGILGLIISLGFLQVNHLIKNK